MPRSRHELSLHQVDARDACDLGTSFREIKTSATLDVVKQAYEAYGRQDLPALLNLIAEKTDWRFIGPASCHMRVYGPTEKK
jgi:hypothetical protein